MSFACHLCKLIKTQSKNFPFCQWIIGNNISDSGLADWNVLVHFFPKWNIFCIHWLITSYKFKMHYLLNHLLVYSASAICLLPIIIELRPFTHFVFPPVPLCSGYHWSVVWAYKFAFVDIASSCLALFWSHLGVKSSGPCPFRSDIFHLPWWGGELNERISFTKSLCEVYS